MGTPTTTRDAILRAIKEYGPMTSAEIAEVTGLSKKKVHGSISGARKNHGSDVFTIHGYQRKTDGTRGGGMATIYKAGPGRDAKRPDLTTKEVRAERDRRYRARHHARILAREAQRRGSRVAAGPFAQLYIATGTANIASKALRE